MTEGVEDAFAARVGLGYAESLSVKAGELRDLLERAGDEERESPSWEEVRRSLSEAGMLLAVVEAESGRAFGVDRDDGGGG